MDDLNTPAASPFNATPNTAGHRLLDVAQSFASHALPPLRRALLPLAAVAALGGAAWWLSQQVTSIPRGQQLVRSNTWTGGQEVLGEGRAWVLPGVHEARLLPARDWVLQAASLQRANSPQALQTVEGLSVGLEVSLRLGLDAKQLPQLARKLPERLDAELVEPALAAILYKQVAQHTVRELFSSQRAEIQRRVETELHAQLAQDGIVLKSLSFGAVDLPADYRRGMDALLSEGLAADKMRYTLDLRAKQGQEAEINANTERRNREIAAEAAAREQLIAAKGQEEAMKHVLPFKQRQIEQRQLEAEAERQSRVKLAEGASQARQIEAEGEAKARQKLADAEAYRVAELGKVNAVQMEREGQLITRHPLLIQKTLADKLGDKVQVIVAPPGTHGQLLAGLVGGNSAAAAASSDKE